MRLFSASSIIIFSVTNCLFTVAMRMIHPPGWSISDWSSFKDRRLHLSDAATVYAWPSTGGRLELPNPSALELDLLGIEDHFNESNKSIDTTEEDAFALRVRRLGGTFYEYQYGSRREELRDAEIHSWLGWPEDEEHKGGVWVLKLKWSELRSPFRPRMTGRIRLAKTMQDRCRAIEMCGGTFYANPTDEHLVPMDPMPSLQELLLTQALSPPEAPAPAPPDFQHGWIDRHE
ncbi:hypothetical protein PV04_04382 [Phialophora macrospora]|uniref:Uncharacterized protein n=1 Tax=Phialophora macrospora TaxID=1851006 RepID=A0A0D2CTD8_9EURO|nr:hypothetical protein PV04_04382 [Phialophora macrospora]